MKNIETPPERTGGEKTLLILNHSSGNLLVRMEQRPSALTALTRLWGTTFAKERKNSVLRVRARRSVNPNATAAHCQTYVKNHALHLIKLNQLNYPGHCRAVGRLRGRILSSVSQWKSRHLPFPHQEVCRQVKNIFYTRNCASHWKSTNLNKTEIAQKPFKV